MSTANVVEKSTPMILNYSSLHVEGRRWFDRINGNTYHTAEVFVARDEDLQWESVGIVEFQYGYGEQYLESARELLVEKGLLPELEYSNGVTLTLQRTCEYVGVALTHSVREVKKYQLHKVGE